MFKLSGEIMISVSAHQKFHSIVQSNVRLIANVQSMPFYHLLVRLVAQFKIAARSSSNPNLSPVSSPFYREVQTLNQVDLRFICPLEASQLDHHLKSAGGFMKSTTD